MAFLGLNVLLSIIATLVEVELSTVATFVRCESLVLKVYRWHLLLSSLDRRRFERRQA